MKDSEWNEGLGNIDPDLVEEYVETKENLRHKQVQKKPWVRLGAMAACICIIVGALFAVPMLRGGNAYSPGGMGGAGGSGSNPWYWPWGGENKYPTYSGNGSSGNIFEGTPDPTSPVFETLSYNGYDAFLKAARVGFEGDYARETYLEQYPDQMRRFDKFISDIKKNGVPLPMFDGKRIELRDREEFSDITVFIKDSYNLPWIWYHPLVETGENFYITVTVIPETVPDELKTGSASKLIKFLSPNSANIDNYQGSKVFDKVYETEVTLKDRKVTALRYEYSSDSRDYTIFIYDGLLIRVRGDAKLWDEEWFSKLSFER